MKICTTDGCARPVLGRGLCAPHYSTWHRAQKKYRIICAHCGKAASMGKKHAAYCSRQCASRAALPAAVAARAKQMKTEAAVRHALRSQVVLYTGPTARPTPATIHSRGRLTWRAGRCKVCDAWFTTWNTDVTCSTECQHHNQLDMKREAKHRRRALKTNSYVADVSRRKVFEADGYRCHLCRRKTDPTKAVPHPRAPTIDHVIPLNRNGTHEPGNVRTACYLCNSTKGDRGGGEQFALAL